ncbi:MAG: formylglycine-generating enzyme family protein [Mailhella sp.]|nr:formylglycine-generating enzyme family protein [Mailhella sp.]
MRRIFLPLFLSLAFGLSSPASAADSLPQWTNAFGMSFRLIPAGKSVIGRYGWAGVEPRREVTISREFGMGTTEVTQGQWKAVMGGKNPSEPFLGSDLPVNRVSWNDAQTFIKKLNELDAPRRYRLPTSAEWEHAYRAGNQATWITGDGTPAFPKSLREYEWFGPDRKTHPVAQKKPNDWGLYDMGGNVREWVQDFWQHDYYGSMPATDPSGPKAGNMRVWRGASYEDPLEACSFVSRDCDKPTARNKWTGFRVVLEGESLKAELGAPKQEKAAEALPAPAGVPAAYVPVLDNMHDILSRSQPDRDWQDGEYGVMERWRGNAGAEALASVGWTLLDLNGDGRKELIISPVEVQDGKATGQEIYALYTEKDGKALLVQEGTTRSCFALMNGGLLKHHGSGGAMMQVLGICGLSADGTLVWHDYWFSDSKNEAHDIGYYWNDKGTTDKSLSQEIPQAAFEKAEEALARQNTEAEFTLFKDWRADESVQTAQPAQPAAASAVRLRWADEALKGALDHETFTAAKGQPQIEVAICADSTVRNVKVLQLDFAGVDDGGKVSFNSTELFRMDRLEQGRPLVITLPLFENIPQYGISYEDEGGNVLRFGITQSGKDGSLELMPF